MAYELAWNSKQPGHFVYLIDLSGSMENKINDVIHVVKSTCDSLVNNCYGIDGPKERLSVSLYGYNHETVPLLESTPSSIKELGLAIMKSEKSNTPFVTVKPTGQTFMKRAFEVAKKDVEDWIKQQKNAGRENIPAPIIMNITDGFPYEGKGKSQALVFEETLKAAQDLTSISTSDGNVRLYNIHFDPESKEDTLKFPKLRPSERHLQFLYDASSSLSEDMFIVAKNYFKEAEIGSRCMLSNVKDLEDLANFIDWGSTK